MSSCVKRILKKRGQIIDGGINLHLGRIQLDIIPIILMDNKGAVNSPLSLGSKTKIYVVT